MSRSPSLTKAYDVLQRLDALKQEKITNPLPPTPTFLHYQSEAATASSQSTTEALPQAASFVDRSAEPPEGPFFRTAPRPSVNINVIEADARVGADSVEPIRSFRTVPEGGTRGSFRMQQPSEHQTKGAAAAAARPRLVDASFGEDDVTTWRTMESATSTRTPLLGFTSASNVVDTAVGDDDPAILMPAAVMRMVDRTTSMRNRPSTAEGEKEGARGSFDNQSNSALLRFASARSPDADRQVEGEKAQLGTAGGVVQQEITWRPSSRGPSGDGVVQHVDDSRPTSSIEHENSSLHPPPEVPLADRSGHSYLASSAFSSFRQDKIAVNGNMPGSAHSSPASTRQSTREQDVVLPPSIASQQQQQRYLARAGPKGLFSSSVAMPTAEEAADAIAARDRSNKDSVIGKMLSELIRLREEANKTRYDVEALKTGGAQTNSTAAAPSDPPVRTGSRSSSSFRNSSVQPSPRVMTPPAPTPRQHEEDSGPAHQLSYRPGGAAQSPASSFRAQRTNPPLTPRGSVAAKPSTNGRSEPARQVAGPSSPSLTTLGPSALAPPHYSSPTKSFTRKVSRRHSSPSDAFFAAQRSTQSPQQQLYAAAAASRSQQDVEREAPSGGGKGKQGVRGSAADSSFSQHTRDLLRRHLEKREASLRLYKKQHEKQQEQLQRQGAADDERKVAAVLGRGQAPSASAGGQAPRRDSAAEQHHFSSPVRRVQSAGPGLLNGNKNNTLRRAGSKVVSGSFERPITGDSPLNRHAPGGLLARSRRDDAMPVGPPATFSPNTAGSALTQNPTSPFTFRRVSAASVDDVSPLGADDARRQQLYSTTTTTASTASPQRRRAEGRGFIDEQEEDLTRTAAIVPSPKSLRAMPLMQYLLNICSDNGHLVHAELQRMVITCCDGTAEGCRDWVALTMLANLPCCAEHIIAPLLVQQLTDAVTTNDPNCAQHDSRLSHVLCALIGLGFAGHLALQPLMEMLHAGTGDSKLVALAIRAVGGSEAIDALCEIVLNPQSSVRMQSVAVYALSLLAAPVKGHTTICCLGIPAISRKVIYYQPSTSATSSGSLTGESENSSGGGAMVVRQRLPPYRATHVIVDCETMRKRIANFLFSEFYDPRPRPGAQASLSHAVVLSDFFAYSPAVCTNFKLEPTVHERLVDMYRELELVAPIAGNSIAAADGEASGANLAHDYPSFVLHNDAARDRILETLMSILLRVNTGPSVVVEQALVSLSVLPKEMTGPVVAEQVLHFALLQADALKKNTNQSSSSSKLQQHQAASNSSNQQLLTAAVVTLGHVTTSDLADATLNEATGLLVQLLEYPEWKIRHAATIALGTIGNIHSSHYHDSIKSIFAKMQEGAVAAETAAWALSRLGKLGVACLVDLLGYAHLAAAARVAAARAIGSLNMSQVVFNIPKDADKLQDIVVNGVIAAVRGGWSKKSAEDVVTECLYALGKTLHVGTFVGRTEEALQYYRDEGRSRLIAPLASLLSGSDGDAASQNVLNSAMDVLVRHGGPHGEVTVTTILLENSNPALRAAAAFGLGSRPAVCVRSLALGMKDASEQVRLAAAKSLAGCAPEYIRTVLDTRPREQLVQVRNAVRDFLVTHGGMQNTSITSHLRDLLGTLA